MRKRGPASWPKESQLKTKKETPLVWSHPATDRTYKDVDEQIAATINENDPEAFLRAARERFEKNPGEYDQGDQIVVPFDAFADLVQLAEVAYAWARNAGSAPERYRESFPTEEGH